MDVLQTQGYFIVLTKTLPYYNTYFPNILLIIFLQRKSSLNIMVMPVTLKEEATKFLIFFQAVYDKRNQN